MRVPAYFSRTGAEPGGRSCAPTNVESRTSSGPETARNCRVPAYFSLCYGYMKKRRYGYIWRKTQERTPPARSWASPTPSPASPEQVSGLEAKPHHLPLPIPSPPSGAARPRRAFETGNASVWRAAHTQRLWKAPLSRIKCISTPTLPRPDLAPPRPSYRVIREAYRRGASGTPSPRGSGPGTCARSARPPELPDQRSARACRRWR